MKHGEIIIILNINFKSSLNETLTTCKIEKLGFTFKIWTNYGQMLLKLSGQTTQN